MEKFFNTAGPIKPELHYYIPFDQRIDWDEIQMLFASQKYFLIHAPRQTGKTTSLLEMMKVLNKAEKYNVLYVNIEAAQTARNDIDAGMTTICSVLARSAELYLKEPRLQIWLNDKTKMISPHDRLNAMLTHWAQISKKPTLLFIDEADALIGDTLISMLRQVRAGYPQRPEAFPQSIVLCGLRDIKDYRIHQSSGDIITGGSAFNIKAESLRIGNFNRKETKALLLQHTSETGQPFDKRIFDSIWEDTKGQPWLVNALAHEMTWKEKTARKRNVPIAFEQYNTARERVISSRATHLDQLADKLRESRVHQVIEALLSGEKTELQMDSDDLQYVEDLGLIIRKPQVHISNRIYSEIIPRELTSVTQDTMNQDQAWYLNSDRQINMPKLVRAFQQFFRENAESWIERFQYKEAGPQLLIQAFLQRIINSGGRIYREYGLGRRRTDLFIQWPTDKKKGFFGKIQRIVIELKIQRGELTSLLPTALKQTADYSDLCGASEAHLIIFNRDSSLKWDEKIWHRVEKVGDCQIQVWGC